MTPSNWTDELRQVVREQYGVMPVLEIVALCTERRGRPFTKNMVIGLAYRMGLSKPMAPSTRQEGEEVYKPILTDKDFVGCRYIEGPPIPLRKNMYCCAPVVEGSAYCMQHFIVTRPRITESAAEHMGLTT